MGIFCVGQAVYDITAPYTGPLQANQKYRITAPHGCSGAPALNAACLCALWGAPTELVARIGEDAYGALVRADLDRCGVGSSYLIPDPEATTGYSFIAVDDKTGDRTIFNVPSAMHDVVYPVPAEKPDVILSDGHEPAVSLQLMEAFPQAQTVVDAGTYRESTYEVARAVDFLVCSEDFARQYTGSGLENPDDAVAVDALLQRIEGINGGVAVVTLGDRGLVYRDEDGSPQHLPAFKAHAVDTTGAGDIFHGAFAYGVYQGLSLRENLRQSSMASSLSVRALGGLTSIPTYTDVRRELVASA
ncbi:PfkB family carbohydrate kinase [Collinsella sp. An2]|uniref:carbohydrate kinase family protein n=1 Tax=Collinsella sp. An2 TaxID=1965585 RepID=UPI000B37CF32|nr:PfkB family carbohydrate kinase [Collinsella sp. An2]OUP07283.1 hypothetical protein B5F33_08950 [Collinsella sp. An2]